MSADELMDRIERAYAAARAANLTIIRLELSRPEYAELCGCFGVPELRQYRCVPMVVAAEMRWVTQ